MSGRRTAKTAERSAAIGTSTRILDAAERLFAERGFHAVSLREITAAANANTAAIHYYFRRKEDLLEAVVDRRAGIVVQERLNRMEALLAGAEPPSLEALILAYVSPGLTVGFDSEELRKYFGRMRARFSHENDPGMRTILRRHFREPGRRLIAAVQKIMPHLSARDVQWRFHILVGILIHLMAHPGRVQAVDGDTGVDLYNPDDMQEALRHVLPMLAMIFRAPPASESTLESALAEMSEAMTRSPAPAPATADT
jgi:AcrR family transcriptional regulator